MGHTPKEVYEHQDALDAFDEYPNVLLIKVGEYMYYRAEKEIRRLPLDKWELIVQEKTNA